MKRIKTNDGSIKIQFSDKDIERAKKEFYGEVDELLSEKYSVNLPLHAIKILLKVCIADTRNDLKLRDQGCAFSNYENMIAKAKQKLIYIVAAQLKEQKLDWKRIYLDTMAEVKKKELNNR